MTATTKWIALALLGLAIAAAVAFLASRLVSEQIGIASESVSAGYELAPAVRSAAAPAGGAGDATSGDRGGGSSTGSTSTGSTTTEAPPAARDESVGADRREDELEDREKEREDALDDREDEREDREDERRDREEDRRDD